MGALLDKPITEKETEQGTKFAHVDDDGDGGHRHQFFPATIRYTVSGMQGWRQEMEDAHIATFDVVGDDDVSRGVGNLSLFGVLDGHGGDWTSKHCAERFVDTLRCQEHFQVYLNLPHQSLRDHPIGLELLQSAFVSTFFQLDEDMVHSEKRLLAGDKLDKSGATCCLVMLTPKYILCANVGDSRAMLQTNGHTVQLSFDHKPSNDEERLRVEQAGGYVSMKRVDGDLAVSRALGDFHFKSSPELLPHLQKVSSMPDFCIVERDPTQDEYIVICCDGVWDVLTCAQCAQIIQVLLDEGERDMKLVAEELLDICLERQSKDNMTALIVDFPDNLTLSDEPGPGVAARRQIRRIREEEEDRKKQERHAAKQKLKAEADEVRRRLAQRHHREEIESDSD